MEATVPANAKAELVVTDENGNETRTLIHNFETPGIIQGLHNIDKSIENFARTCFNYALDAKKDLWFSSKDTISKKYDHRFKDIFNEVFEKDYKEKFEEAGIEYFYTLIDDAVARVIRSEGGYIWACKNYDGDVMSDMVATAYGSLAMMTSALVSPTEYTNTKQHTVQFRDIITNISKVNPLQLTPLLLSLRGAVPSEKEASLTIFELVSFAENLEKATIDTIESGTMTGDLYAMSNLENKKKVDTEGFLVAIGETLKSLQA